MNLPTVKQLRYFVALEEKEHFGKAAEACFVSQSAFSVAIKELESHLGAQLVDRTNKNVTITRIGREVANQARHCLRDIEYLAEVARSNQEMLTGRLNMGVIPTIAPFVLPSLMPRLRESFPDLQLYLREDTTQSIYGRLMSGELDVVLLALPYKLSNVETFTLFRDHFLLACHKDTRFLDPTCYNFHSLPDESVLLLEDGHCLRDHALSACKIQNQETVSRFAASSLYTLIEMVDSDIGITYLTDMAKDSMILRHTDIKTYPIGEQRYRDIGLAWRKGSARGEEFKMLGEVIATMHKELFQSRGE
ncbi:hydrogen peroxide-inducible genes activator [Leucothrix pacifica]|uniref:LysR family transcriptional regulator n=1 Tax=Leucothrix pacifica TaxID=1247513 RepID=A0A317CNM2_9GAMM|nr:hydrogen peroxide-inducible genes activator [Leucothrix pacifica]PWQ99801.1 LysR family transcriptional regulator [Leucothrix pacifica]